MVEDKVKLKLMEYDKSLNGKHSGWAYQFLDDDYQGFHGGVCCKDFLNDIVWSELTQKSMCIYGQHSSYKGILDKQEYLKLCMYPYLLNAQQEPVIKNIEVLKDNLQAFLNEIELLKGFELSTIEVHDNKFVIIFHKNWISKIYLFSMFTLLCRIGVYYDGNLEEYMQNPYKPENIYLDNCDSYYLKDNYKEIIQIINNELIIDQVDWKDTRDEHDVHDNNSLFYSLATLKGIETDEY